MLFNFNIDIANKRYPNKIDIYENAIKDMLKIKKNINKHEKYNVNSKNTNQLNNFQDQINDFKDQNQLMDLENAYKSSLILLDMMEQEMQQTVLKKYGIEKNEVNQSILMKKKFLNNPLQILSKIK